jgi:hypothetical protein
LRPARERSPLSAWPGLAAAPVLGRRAADIIAFLDAAALVAADIALVAFVGLNQLAFARHGASSLPYG